jgi:hypothetical protein
MLTTAERQEKIEMIRKLPATVESAVAGMNDVQLDTPYRSGGWTVRQVIHHLADSHLNAFVRMKLILTEESPTLKPYDQDEWAKLPDTMHMPIGHSIGILRGLHERWTVLLRSLPEEAWARIGIHPERGKISIENILITYSGHGAKHVEQIAGLRKSRKW